MPSFIFAILMAAVAFGYGNLNGPGMSNLLVALGCLATFLFRRDIERIIRRRMVPKKGLHVRGLWFPPSYPGGKAWIHIYQDGRYRASILAYEWFADQWFACDGELTYFPRIRMIRKIRAMLKGRQEIEPIAFAADLRKAAAELGEDLWFEWWKYPRADGVLEFTPYGSDPDTLWFFSQEEAAAMAMYRWKEALETKKKS